MSFMREPRMPMAEEALPGRDGMMSVADRHYVNGNRMQPPFDGMTLAIFGSCNYQNARRF